MDILTSFSQLPSGVRILAFVLMAILAHFLVRSLRRLSLWLIDPANRPKSWRRSELFAYHNPKVATVASLATSAAAFAIYFSALGLVFKEFQVSLTAYLATASVVGLAVAFGSQGLVQDVVIGLTLVFSDVFDIGDVVEVSGQVGRVESIGLRFTTIVNLFGQSVYVPNRNIALVGRYRKGCIRAYVDVQVPEGAGPAEIESMALELGRSFKEQHAFIVQEPPESFGVKETARWRYVRLRFRLWPGQQAIIEGSYRQKLLSELKKRHPGYEDHMVAVTYRVP